MQISEYYEAERKNLIDYYKAIVKLYTKKDLKNSKMDLKEFDEMINETEIPVCHGSKLVGMSIEEIEDKFKVVVTSVRNFKGKLITVKGSNKKIKELLK